MSATRVVMARVWAWAAAVCLPLLAGGCFDGEELTEGLKCTQNSHCGGSLRCVGGYCSDLDSQCADTDIDCMATASATATATSATATTATATTDVTTVGSAESSCAEMGASCAAGETCCTGLCVDYGNGVATCEQSCTYGTECASCCCVPLTDMSGSACVATSYCGQEAACPGAGCASPGSSCSYDGDCCGGRCLLNAGNYYSCFKTCTVATDCVSGCCNYKSDYGTSICETC